MPLSAKGQKILAELIKQYGEKKGKQVFYAMENKGKIKGIVKTSSTPHLDKVLTLAASMPHGPDGKFITPGGASAAAMTRSQERKAARAAVEAQKEFTSGPLGEASIGRKETGLGPGTGDYQVQAKLKGDTFFKPYASTSDHTYAKYLAADVVGLDTKGMPKSNREANMRRSAERRAEILDKFVSGK